MDAVIAPIKREEDEVARGVCGREGQRNSFGGGVVAGIIADGLYEGDGYGGGRDDLGLVEVGGSGGVSQLQDAEDADENSHHCQDGDEGGKAFLAFRGTDGLR
jgi:hypothetical protein